MGGFSFASVILSYFLIAGGLFFGILANYKLASTSELVGLGLLAAGSFIGGFFAARASRGSTIVEPAIGGVLLVATLLGLAFGTSALDVLRSNAPVAKWVGELAGCVVVGALVGALLSEKLFGEASRSAVPWLFYSAFASLGASVMSLLVVAGVLVRGGHEHTEHQTTMITFGGLAIGSLLAGLVIGASARVRVAVASFLGGVVGVGLMGLMLAYQSGSMHDKELWAGIAVFAAVGGIIVVLGSALGWVAVGKRAA
jgi:hypothetical protein